MQSTAAIDRLLQDAVKAGEAPGVAAAAADASGPIYQGASGRRSVATDAPMTTDTVFRIASMTKAVTATAAMQMVEQGKLGLDTPAGDIVPDLASPQVLEGFSAGGEPVLRPARGTVTLRKLLTHTSGFVYEIWDEKMKRYVEATGLPAARTGKLTSLGAPLAFDPGERWEYGIGIDWAGRMVETVSGQNLEAYMRAHIFDPLHMPDSGYMPKPDWGDRLAGVHGREADGSLQPVDSPLPAAPPEFFPGGGGLYSTVGDYLRFLRMLMNGGSLDGAQVLKPETVALMAQNSMGELNVLPLRSSNLRLSADAEFFPGMEKKWGLSFLINTQDGPAGRSAGSLAWAGLYNTYFWLDPRRKIAGVLMTQILPFADPKVLGLLDRFESAIYR
jgi:CubicO group peptidase (beta-lactamase class C family)